MKRLSIHFSFLLSPGVFGMRPEEWASASDWKDGEMSWKNVQVQLGVRPSTGKDDDDLIPAVSHQKCPEGLWVRFDKPLEFDMRTGEFGGLDKLRSLQSVNGCERWTLAVRSGAIILDDRGLLRRKDERKDDHETHIRPVSGSRGCLEWEVEVASIRENMHPKGLFELNQRAFFGAIHADVETWNGGCTIAWRESPVSKS
jgi:hypothetical protein